MNPLERYDRGQDYDCLFDSNLVDIPKLIKSGNPLSSVAILPGCWPYVGRAFQKKQSEKFDPRSFFFSFGNFKRVAFYESPKKKPPTIP